MHAKRKLAPTFQNKTSGVFYGGGGGKAPSTAPNGIFLGAGLSFEEPASVDTFSRAPRIFPGFLPGYCKIFLENYSKVPSKCSFFSLCAVFSTFFRNFFVEFS